MKTFSSYVITCIGRPVDPHAIKKITTLLSEERIDVQKIITLAQKQIECIEILISSTRPIDSGQWMERFHHLHSDFGIDIIIQEGGHARKKKRLMVIDMDSTLTEIEVIDELAKEAGVGDKVESITQRAMNGELSFTEALHERVGLLRGLPVETLENVYKQMPFTPGAKKLLLILKKLAFRTAILSGGFDYFTSRVEKSLGFDYSYSNCLEIEGRVLSGRIIGEIVDGVKKASLMEEIARKEGIPLDQVIAVGDGANDLPMIEGAGLGIAFDAKPAVRAATRFNISYRDLSLILYLLGMNENEIEAFGLNADSS